MLVASRGNVVAYGTGGDCKVFNSSGNPVLTVPDVKQAKFISSSLWVVRIQTNGDAIEEWNVTAKKRLRSFFAGRKVSLGARSGDNLFYIADSAIVRRSISRNQVLDTRTITNDYLRDDSVATNGKSVFFAASHEVYGLNAGDFDSGWRSYCDLKPEVVDAQGIICSGGLKFGLGSLGFDGRMQWSLPQSRDHDRFHRDTLVVSGKMIFAAGVRLRPGGDVVSAMLYGIRRSDGKQLWNGYLIPLAMGTVDKGLAVLAGYRLADKPTSWNPYSSGAYQLGLRVEVRNPANGRLLARTSKFPAESAVDIAAVGGSVFVLNGKKLTRYRVT